LRVAGARSPFKRSLGVALRRRVIGCVVALVLAARYGVAAARGRVSGRVGLD